MSRQSKMKEKVHKNTTEFILHWPTTPGHGTRSGPVHAAMVSENSCVYQSHCVRRSLCAWSHPSALALIIFPPVLLLRSLREEAW